MARLMRMTDKPGRYRKNFLVAGFILLGLTVFDIFPESPLAQEKLAQKKDTYPANQQANNGRDQKQKVKTASDTVGRKKMSQEKLGLEDEEFWSQPFKTKDAIENRLIKKKTEALIVGAPSKVLINTRETFPVVALQVAFLKNLAKMDLRKTAIVTAVELNSNRVHAGMALRQDMDLPPADGEMPEGWMGGEGYLIDLRERLQLPWKPGDYIVTLLMLDQASERLRTRLVDTSGFEDPEVARFIEEHRKKAGLSLVWPEPGDPLPSYKQEKESPPIPSERVKFKEDEEEPEIDEEEMESGKKRERKPGMALSVPRVSVIDENTRCILSGSFRLPVKEQELLPQDKAPKPAKPAPVALMPITLVLTGTEQVTPTVLRLIVPSYDPIDKTIRGPLMVTGHFTIDLCTLAPVAKVPQTFFIYAFSGEIMAGPAPMAFISKSSLEP
jgi:hypothetical protein